MTGFANRYGAVILLALLISVMLTAGCSKSETDSGSGSTSGSNPTTAMTPPPGAGAPPGAAPPPGVNAGAPPNLKK